MQWQVYASLDGWRWRAFGPGRRLLAHSGLAYGSVGACEAAMQQLARQSIETTGNVIKCMDGWRWQVLSAGLDILAESDKAHISALTARLAVGRWCATLRRGARRHRPAVDTPITIVAVR